MIIDHHDGAVSLDKVSQLSPHLSRLMAIHRDDLITIQNHDFDIIIASADTMLTDAVTATRDDAGLMAAIRHYRGRINHLVAMTDFLNIADVGTHMTWLTHAAEHALKTLTAHLAGDDDHHWFVLALGKMGAGELNYSSDIDLVIITLHDQADYAQSKNFIALTRRVITIMSTPTRDGIGWRIDLRLRPDPGATPIAIHHDAAMIYYESMARTWERAAFIRARPVAGNIKAGHDFLQNLTPFIWRRYLDYTVLEDLKVMLRRDGRSQDLLGYNVKNGMGGIRSIEFFVHAQQLIAGGRENGLRRHSTIKALDALALNNWITDDTADQLKQAYLAWRRLEHRLQMMGDAQTHILPKSEQALTDFASFCGCADSMTFKDRVTRLGDIVHQATKGLMERIEKGRIAGDGRNIASPQASLTLNWDNDHSDHSKQVLHSLGYQQPETIILTVQGWLAGRIPATRSPRSRDILQHILAGLLTALAETDRPDISFAAFARLVEKLPAGLQLFSLIQTHPKIADMIVNIVTAAPKLADIISNDPALADNLLYQSFWRPEDNWPGRYDDVMDALTSADDYEDRLLILRRYCREWKFRTSVQLLQNQITPDQAARDYSVIADGIITAAAAIAQRTLEDRFGHMADSGMTVLALGRLGSKEMTLQSDLDLIFIYDGPLDAQSEGGTRSVTIGQYYSRFGQELINVLSALTAEGRCYDIDMRLRPSGNKGPVAVHWDSFVAYQKGEAWTWEHMALIKSRIITHIGERPIDTRLEGHIPAFIKRPRDTAALIDDVAAMRDRLHDASLGASYLNIRSCNGGIMDIDFLTQMMQMMPQAQALPIYRRSGDSIRPLAEAGLLNHEDIKPLKAAIRIYSDAIQLMRLLDMKEDDNKALSDSLPTLLQKRFEINTFGEFSAFIEATAKPVSSLMKKYVCKVKKRE